MELTNKLMRIWLSSVLLGEGTPPFQLRGTKEELSSLAEALYATHLFETELKNEQATVESVTEALDRKHRAVNRFEKVFGKNIWPL